MITLKNYTEKLSQALRDILRGVDPAGTLNAIESYVKMPEDFNEDGSLRPFEEQIDKRECIIVGPLKTKRSGAIITIEYLQNDNIAFAAQGSTCYESEGDVWAIKIETTGCKKARTHLMRIMGEIRGTLTQADRFLYKDCGFDKISLNQVNNSENDSYRAIVFFKADTYLTN